MGDYDSEMYNTANETYNEVIGMHGVLKEINKNLARLVEEVKGLRDDLKRI
jgi:hypothetical protein